jgi:hypothetical protein
MPTIHQNAQARAMDAPSHRLSFLTGAIQAMLVVMFP